MVGLHLYGAGCALLMAAHLGSMPWDVLHQGLARITGLSVGACMILVGAAVMLLWIPLRQRPGVGTLSNVLLVGVWTDLWLRWLPEPEALPVRCLMLALGILAIAGATALYIGARLGPGPRDGLMVGLTERLPVSLRVARTVIEVAVVAAGVLLGGTLGVGTVLFAVVIGPLTQVLMPLGAVPAPAPAPERSPAP
ncbi:hypothetical protein LG943_09170 [Streptomonospora sp. S1-112]|uniref:Membrane protein YczE n=2 Tax=Streptomonospora mangrovi TaxID=2883123 RepID=A0A9X3SF63_9ACTN|nr:hypothetical protein [Streptomonospora mangrovi]MDA0564495.1 hypothetical protein [Streptomonospora mangrovi]